MECTESVQLYEIHGIHGIPWISIDFHGIHGIPLISWKSIDSMKCHVIHGIQWTPRSSMEAMSFELELRLNRFETCMVFRILTDPQGRKPRNAVVVADSDARMLFDVFHVS